MLNKMISHTRILLFILLIFGFLYRFYFTQIAETNIIYDMASYEGMAKALLTGSGWVDCCDHSSGYSVFLAGIYKVFGIDNLPAVQIVQILLDLLNALLVYSTAKSLFNKNSAVFSFSLYIINPFTASYTGLRLPEIVTLFIMSLIAYTVSRKSFAGRKETWFSLGIFLGLLLFLRPSAEFAIPLIFLGYIIFCVKKLNKIYFGILFIIGFALASSYPLFIYYKNYRKVAITPPYNIGKGVLYWNFYASKYPELYVDFDKLNPKIKDLEIEFHTTYYLYNHDYINKYFSLFLKKLPEEWPLYTHNTLKNMFWIWDKYHLSYYVDPFYPKDVIPLRLFNIFSLILFFTGLCGYAVQKGLSVLSKPIILFTIIIAVNITFIFALASNETRHSLYAYSLVYLWGGYGLSRILKTA